MDHATSIETLTTSLTVTYSGESNPPPSTSVRQSCSVLSNYLSICLEGGWGGADADLALRLIQPEPEQPGGFVVVLFL